MEIFIWVLLIALYIMGVLVFSLFLFIQYQLYELYIRSFHGSGVKSLDTNFLKEFIDNYSDIYYEVLKKPIVWTSWFGIIFLVSVFIQDDQRYKIIYTMWDKKKKDK